MFITNETLEQYNACESEKKERYSEFYNTYKKKKKDWKDWEEVNLITRTTPDKKRYTRKQKHKNNYMEEKCE